MKALGIAVLLSSIISMPATAAQPLEAISGVPTIIDGDTLNVAGQRIRLHGIDAPEAAQVCQRHADGGNVLCGKEAALRLSERIGGQPITCQPQKKDRYERLIAICKVNGLDLGAWMVTMGQALAYRQYSTDYSTFEDAARISKLGIWATSFTPPWEWRRNRPKPQKTVSGSSNWPQ